MNGILGIKKGMTQIFDSNGLVVPVTVIEAGPCPVTQVKSKKSDGYDSVQIAFVDKREKNVTKPAMGQFNKAKVSPKKYLREFQISSDVALGGTITVGQFQAGDFVVVSGISKGKGFQGVIKRHKFGGARASHGQKSRLRSPGSIGQSSWPSKVFKGIKMGGRMGGERVTTKDVEIIKVDAENNLIFLKGSVPGAKNSLVEIKN